MLLARSSGSLRRAVSSNVGGAATRTRRAGASFRAMRLEFDKRGDPHCDVDPSSIGSMNRSLSVISTLISE